MISLKEISHSFLHLLFPHICCGCGNDMLQQNNIICLRCMNALPETGFEQSPGNLVEKKFWGRIPLINASAQYHFTRESLIQELMHQFKYKANKELGLHLGRMMGTSLATAGRFNADALIPLPLFPSREKRRGYNQATVLCEGISESMGIPVLKNSVIRATHTDTQTLKGRVERWRNMEGKFYVTDPSSIADKHLLLIDDVVTTGATLEACGMELLAVDGVSLSVATLCYASRR